MASSCSATTGCRPVPRQCRPALVPALRRRPRLAVGLPSLPDGVATQEAFQQAPEVLIDTNTTMNNAVAHPAAPSRSSSTTSTGTSGGGTGSRHPQQQRQQQQREAPLPPLVDRMLSSPTLERPEGTGKGPGFLVLPVVLH